MNKIFEQNFSAGMRVGITANTARAALVDAFSRQQAELAEVQDQPTKYWPTVVVHTLTEPRLEEFRRYQLIAQNDERISEQLFVKSTGDAVPNVPPRVHASIDAAVDSLIGEPQEDDGYRIVFLGLSVVSKGMSNVGDVVAFPVFRRNPSATLALRAGLRAMFTNRAIPNLLVEVQPNVGVEVSLVDPFAGPAALRWRVLTYDDKWRPPPAEKYSDDEEEEDTDDDEEEDPFERVLEPMDEELASAKDVGRLLYQILELETKPVSTVAVGLAWDFSHITLFRFSGKALITNAARDNSDFENLADFDDRYHATRRVEVPWLATMATDRRRADAAFRAEFERDEAATRARWRDERRRPLAGLEVRLQAACWDIVDQVKQMPSYQSLLDIAAELGYIPGPGADMPPLCMELARQLSAEGLAPADLPHALAHRAIQAPARAAHERGRGTKRTRSSSD